MEIKEKKYCKYQKKCGGCTEIGQKYEETLRRKEEKVRDCLKPYVELNGITGMEDPYHYRNKIHRVCALSKKGKHIARVSGIYAEGSHDVIPVEKCLIEDDHAEAIIRDVLKLVQDYRVSFYDEDTGRGLLRHILIRTAKQTGQIMLVFVIADREFPGKRSFIKQIRKIHPEISAIIFNVNDRQTNMVLGERETAAYGSCYIEDILCGKRFRISPRSFYQINPVQTEKIYQTAIEYAGLTGKETVIDAYCGIGTIGIALADRARQVIGVESNREAVRDAIANAKLNAVKQISFVAQDASVYMRKLADAKQRVDVIVMDPPRSGSTPEFIHSCASLRPGCIVYISCNPETLARDLKTFRTEGYRAVRAEAFDQFPWTEHVETVVCLSNKNARPKDYVEIGVDAEDYYRMSNFFVPKNGTAL